MAPKRCGAALPLGDKRLNGCLRARGWKDAVAATASHPVRKPNRRGRSIHNAVLPSPTGSGKTVFEAHAAARIGRTAEPISSQDQRLE